MRTSSVETVLGALILLIAIVFLLYSVKAGEVERTEGYTINAQFNQIGGLSIGDAVRVSGVKIGTIKSITLSKETYLANVEASIDRGIKLPVDSAATVASSGLMGGNYLEISPGGDEAMLDNKGNIEFTQDAQNLEKLLGQFIFTIDGKNGDKGDETATADATAFEAPAAKAKAPAEAEAETESEGSVPPASAMPAM